jgi:transposase
LSERHRVGSFGSRMDDHPLCHELRKLMASADYGGPLGGGGKHVEIDETAMGGFQTHKERKAKGSNKSLVFGMVERDGKLRAGPIPDLSAYTLEVIVRENVIEGTKITADEWDAYNDLKHGFELGRVNHSKKQWKAGVHHTNTIEGHWGHFKRAVLGTHAVAWRQPSSAAKRHCRARS